ASASTTSTGTNEKNATVTTPVMAAAANAKPQPSGILGLTSDLFDLRRKIRVLKDTGQLTDQLAATAKQLRAPLVAKMRQLTQAGDQLSSVPDSQDPEVLAQQKKQLDAMTAQFKQISASVLPLAKQSVLLDLYKRSVSNWRNAVESQYDEELKGLILRLGVLAVVLAMIFGMS